MQRKSFSRGSVSFCSLLLLSFSLRGEITVEGLSDRKVYSDRVSFRIVVEGDGEYSAELNGEAVPAGEKVEVADPDYYELLVRRTGTGGEEEKFIRFIVKASERGGTEVGLPPWTPFPQIPSSDPEFTGSHLVIVVPARWVRGLEIPFVALLEDGEGERVGVNGVLKGEAFPGSEVTLFRGVGSRILPAEEESGLVSYVGRVGPLETTRQIEIEEETEWREMSGSISESVDWGEGARVHVTADLTVEEGASLAIGAGSVIKLDGEADFLVKGKLFVRGSREDPVIFLPADRSAPWGGFQLRSADSHLEATGAILTGGGAVENWFAENPGSGHSHRHEQPVVFVSNGAHAVLSDTYIIYNKGQCGHGEDGFLTMTKCVAQRAVTFGQYNGGSVTLDRCALVEFPEAGRPFADADNDAIYLSGGSHSFTRCLIGWTLDDGIDAGGSASASVRVAGCWFESCYHEAMAFSGAGERHVRETVCLNCGQGIECGYGREQVYAENCLSTADLVGARYGDSYDWDYDGFRVVMVASPSTLDSDL